MLLQLRPLFPRRVPGGQVVCPFGPRVGGPKLTVCPAIAHAPSRPRWLPLPQPAPAAYASIANIESRAPPTGSVVSVLRICWSLHGLDCAALLPARCRPRCGRKRGLLRRVGVTRLQHLDSLLFAYSPRAFRFGMMRPLDLYSTST